MTHVPIYIYIYIHVHVYKHTYLHVCIYIHMKYAYVCDQRAVSPGCMCLSVCPCARVLVSRPGGAPSCRHGARYRSPAARTRGAASRPRLWGPHARPAGARPGAPPPAAAVAMGTGKPGRGEARPEPPRAGARREARTRARDPGRPLAVGPAPFERAPLAHSQRAPRGALTSRAAGEGPAARLGSERLGKMRVSGGTRGGTRGGGRAPHSPATPGQDRREGGREGGGSSRLCGCGAGDSRFGA